MLDVKSGAGAFMKTLTTRALADRSCRSAPPPACTEALITTMDAPLGATIGNALEVIECVEVLKGRGPEDLTSLSTSRRAMLVLPAYAPTRPAPLVARGSLGCGLAKLRA